MKPSAWLLIVVACLCVLHAQPVSPGQLRQLQDVRVANPPANGDVLTWSTSLGKWTNSATGASTAQTNMFSTVVVSNRVLFPYTTLTYSSGSNLTAMDFSASSAWRLTLTNDAFLVTPSGLPGTNQLQGAQLHVLQDATGGRKLTVTNGTFIVSGSGTSSNAVLNITTNAGGYSVVTFATSPFDAAKVAVVSTALGP